MPAVEVGECLVAERIAETVPQVLAQDVRRRIRPPEVDEPESDPLDIGFGEMIEPRLGAGLHRRISQIAAAVAQHVPT